MNLHPKGINLSNLTTKDLEAIAYFHRIIKNYIKLKRISNEKTRQVKSI